MTGIEHYREGELLASEATTPDHIALAQVHATLALAAATALASITEAGLPDADRTAWIAAASEHPGQQKRFREAEAAELAENG